MDITNRIIVALLERMKSRNKNFLLSRPKFHRLFQINPDGYLWYGEKLERHLLNKYGESADTLKYLDIYYFISNIVRLYYMPKNSNSEENEFGKLYAYGSIIGLHRCHIPDKRIYLNRLLNTLLFCCPTSEEYIRRFRWQKNGIYYKSQDVEVLIADTFTEIRESDKQSESIEIVESIVNETYRYLVGSNTGLPFVRSETLLHYNLNPSDYMWLYQHDKELFYTCLDAAALQSEIFSYKSFVYNFNLYILKDANILDELSRYSKCYEAVLELLFKSDSIMQNSVIRQIKLCRNEDTIKQNNRLDAINKWLNSLNKIGCHRTLNIRK
jgi:hypothetical protein